MSCTLIRMIDAFSYDWTTYRPDQVAVLCFLRQYRTEGSPQVLLIEKKRGLGAGKVNAPGGKTDPGETPLQTAIRETTEEVGLTPEELTDHGVLRFLFSDGYHLQVHIFLAYRWSGTMIETDEALPFWIDEREIPFHRMWEDDAHWLPKVLAGETVDAEMFFDGDRMITWDLRFSGGTHRRGTVT